MIVNEGLNHILDVQFHGESQVATWYIGLTNSGTIAAADTMASHGGWTEITAYDGNRKEFVEGAASGQSISNSGNAASFTMNAEATIQGMFLTSDATGSAGKLFSAVLFSGPRTLQDDDTLAVTYTISAADDGA